MMDIMVIDPDLALTARERVEASFASAFYCAENIYSAGAHTDVAESEPMPGIPGRSWRRSSQGI